MAPFNNKFLMNCLNFLVQTRIIDINNYFIFFKQIVVLSYWLQTSAVPRISSPVSFLSVVFRSTWHLVLMHFLFVFGITVAQLGQTLVEYRKDSCISHTQNLQARFQKKNSKKHLTCKRSSSFVRRCKQ